MTAEPEPGNIQKSHGWVGPLFDIQLAVENLKQHKLRSLLTMLGIIFGVAAVIAMLSIGAGAKQQVMVFIEQLGIRNLIIEAKEITDRDELFQKRKLSPGLTLQDLRTIRSSVDGVELTSARKRYPIRRIMPKPQRDVPTCAGVDSTYPSISNLKIIAGRFFNEEESDRAAPVAVLGQGAKTNLFGEQEAIGEYVELNEQWFRVIGVVAPQLNSSSGVDGLPAMDLNNLIFIPLNSGILRLAGDFQNEIDGIYIRLYSPQLTMQSAEVVRALLKSAHRGVDDFSVIAPAELLAERQRTQKIFDWVMVAIASISLFVGGIGIMNILLANVLEQTREIGIRRSVGARRMDIVRQFLVQAVMISVAGGLIGILFGFGLSRLIAWLAGWSTIMTLSSILISFFFSFSIGLIFGIYPAMKAAGLNPVEAIRYE